MSPTRKLAEKKGPLPGKSRPKRLLFVRSRKWERIIGQESDRLYNP
jgi:hypothetical protein